MNNESLICPNSNSWFLPSNLVFLFSVFHWYECFYNSPYNNTPQKCGITLDSSPMFIPVVCPLGVTFKMYVIFFRVSNVRCQNKHRKSWFNMRRESLIHLLAHMVSTVSVVGVESWRRCLGSLVPESGCDTHQFCSLARTKYRALVEL